MNDSEKREDKDEKKSKKWKPMSCGFCLSKDEDNICHWISQCPKINPSNIEDVYNANFCIFCLQEDTEIHQNLKCKITDFSGNPLIIFCLECDCNKIFCDSREDHTLSTVPDEARELGHNVQFCDVKQDE